MTRKGMGGHQSARAETTTWLTPRPILTALGPFDLDPCAAPEPRPWPTAGVHYTWPQHDGLAMPWWGRVWLNPPYSAKEIGKWLLRMRDHGRGTALIFARTETEAFRDGVWRAADALLFLEGRIHFHHADGRRSKENGGAPSVLVAYGAEDAERLLASPLKGQPVALKAPVLIYLGMRMVHTTTTWGALVAKAIAALGGRATLGDVYEALASHPKAESNRHWRAKVRQTMARSSDIEKVADATYAVRT